MLITLQTITRPWPQCMFVCLQCTPTICCECVTASVYMCMICGWSHPSGVRYLIAPIDRPKESVTFSSYAGGSPNKAVVVTVVEAFVAKLIRPAQTTQVKKERGTTMSCNDFPAVDDCTTELSRSMMAGVEVGFPLSAVAPWGFQVCLQTRHRGF